ncbi:MAG: hypothetical protein ACRELB_16810 [Polyangiaceae bacterium]
MGPSASCGYCDCGISGDACTGMVRLFSDTQCAGEEFDVPADGVCRPAPVGIGTVGAYRHVGNAPTGVSCAPTGTSMVTTSWQNTVTICCAP